MPFQLSPGVNVTEIDLTTVIPAVATTDAAIGGVFKWGAVDKPTLVVSEAELANEYGKPDSDNAETWFTAANFLAYSNRLHVSRAHNSTGDNVRIAGYTTVLNANSGAYAINGASYIAIPGNVATGASDGDIIAQTVAGFADDQTITVDTSTIEFTAGDLTVIANTSGNIFEGLTTGLTIFEGEEVQIVSDPTGGLPTGLSNTDVYYLVNVSTTLDSFQLAATPGGPAVPFSTQGTGDLVLTRAGSTRITLVGGTYTGSTGALDLEVHSPDLSFNAVANNVALSSTSLLKNHIVKNDDHYDTGIEGNFDNSVLYIAKYPGALGNSLKVSVCPTADAFSSNIVFDGDATLDITIGSNNGIVSSNVDAVSVTDVTNNFNVGDIIKVGNTLVGIQHLEITSVGAVTTNSTANLVTVGFSTPLVTTSSISFNTGNLNRQWQYKDVVDGAPGQSDYVASQGNTAANDELHVVVVDEDGEISGIPNTILEVWQGLSRASDAKGTDGESIYYKDVLNQSSKWVWWANDSSTAPSATAILVASSSDTLPLSISFRQGRDIGNEATCEEGSILRAYDLFKSAEDYDISLVLGGKSRGLVNGVTIPNYIIDNICERRKDCVAFISPEKADVVANGTDITEDVVDFRNNLRSTSYAVLDSGYKYQYDKYNDVYRWIPLNGDIAGLAARTDDTRDPWFSPAGFNRGNIKNVVKLAWNPKKAERDILYKNGVNPIVNFPGQGIVMFGDKTLLAKPSAFDRINVRRLFIVLEKAIATAAKFTLFEFNDEFTRASFVNLVTPFLRDVQGRRGITDFAVICDETNNTGEVIDRNEFVGDIYIKPARSINFIQLNFVAVRTGVEFSEVIGQF
jgi:hypothetical protein